MSTPVPSAAVTEAERAAMRRALALAGRARGTVLPNPRVGAVVLRGDETVGEGFHRGPGTAHGEAAALAAAGDAARGATLVVTLEPCNHTGRTPPCTAAILDAGVRRVVYALDDPHAAAHGGAERLRAAGVEVVSGLHADDAWRLNDVFHVWHESSRPLVALKVATSLDGRIAVPEAKGEGRWITSLPAREQGHRLRAACDAILVGIGTVLADDPLLTVRHVRGRHPLRVVLDSQLRIPAGAKVLGPDAPTLIFTTDDASPLRRRQLQEAGYEVLVAPADPRGRVDPHAVTWSLARREVRSVLLEGGRGIYTAFLRAGLVDRLHVFVAPRLIGGAGLGWTGDLGADLPLPGPRLWGSTVRRVGPDVLLEGYLRGPGSPGRPA